MAFVFACEFPEDLWYQVAMDVWLRALPDGALEIGMTDPAVTRAGRIVQVAGRSGRQVERGQRLVTIESAKWVGAVPAPVGGTVLAVNPELRADPGLPSRDPYGRGWLVRLAPAAGGQLAELGLLRGPAALALYREKLQAERIHCIRCADR